MYMYVCLSEKQINIAGVISIRRRGGPGPQRAMLVNLEA